MLPITLSRRSLGRHHRFEVSFESVERVVVERRVRRHPGHHIHEIASFATFIYEKAAERLLRHFTAADENKVIRQARVWCDENS